MYRVIGTEQFTNEFESLKLRAKNNDGEAVRLVKLIEKGIEKLKFDFKYGKHISKDKIPDEYIEKFGVENLWKLDLNSFWRLIYTIRGDEVEVISIVIEVLDHKSYDRKFGYQTT